MRRTRLLVCLWSVSALVACNDPSSSPDAQGYIDAQASTDGGKRDGVAPGDDAAPDQSSTADALAPDSSTTDLAPAPDSSLPDVGPAIDRGADQGSIVPDAAVDTAPQLPDAAALPDGVVDAASLLDQTAASDAGQALAPTISPSSGSYPWGQTVTISTSEADASIYYTLDGGEPSSSSPLYGVPFALATEGIVVVKAIAIKAGLQPSSVSSATYTIGSPALLRVKTPQISPVGGIYDSDQYVTISVETAGATIRYTTDGSRPTQFSAVYAGPILVGGHGTSRTITAIAMKAGMVSSEAASASYLINYPQVAKPQLTPAGGSYEADQGVTISVTTPGAVIHYTTNESTPTVASPVYDGTPIKVELLGTTMTINAIAFHEGMWAPSEMASETYVRACSTGNHDGGDGRTCVANGQCLDDYHDDGTGLCVAVGCATGYVYSADKCRVIFTAVSAGWYDGCGLKPDGSITCWGANSFGQLDVPTLPSGVTFTAVSAGEYNTCALKSDGGIACWGYNNLGQCNVPTLDPGVTFTAVSIGSAGGQHACGLTSAGGITCWGWNGWHECDVPTLPAGVTFTAVSAGRLQTCGLKSDGSIACWGHNGDGECSAPAPSPGSPFTAVSTGSYHTCGLKQDGSIVCWGLNGDGQCTVPALPPGVTFTAVRAAFYYSCGLRSDGSIVCWGKNNFGQLNVPALPSGITFTAVSASYYHVCALKSDGAAVCWGDNLFGQATPP